MEQSELYRTFRIGWPIKIFGFILIISGIGVLYWNEGQSVNFIISLDEALKDAIAVDATQPIEESYNGHLVYVTGPLVVGEPLTEPDYNIDVMAVKLKRRVQMYQHVEETSENFVGETVTESRTYYYRREWRDDLVDSRSFQFPTTHRNPERFPLESTVQVADAVFIGNYELSYDVKNRFNNFVDLTSDSRPDDPMIKIHSGFYYHSADVFNPAVGDIRILFSFAGMEGDVYTVVGVLEQNKIVPYKSSRNVIMTILHSGEHKISDIFKREYYNQRLTTWRYRFMGWVLTFFGMTCLSSLVRYVLSTLPFLRNITPNIDHPLCANLIYSISLFLAIASIVWVIHRPLLAGGLMVAAMSPFLWFARGMEYI